VIDTLQLIKRFLADQSGPTSAEYAMLLAFILMLLYAAVTSVGNSTSGLWNHDVGQIAGALNS
jgi:Flp pilus assembly pilin Flp